MVVPALLPGAASVYWCTLHLRTVHRPLRVGCAEKGAPGVMHEHPAAARPETAPAELVVVESKLQLPVLHPEHVTRPRLLQQLDAALGRRLTLVDAPTGFGK